MCEAVDTDKEREKRQDLYYQFKAEIDKRQLSNTEGYDKAVLSLATIFLGTSLTFLKDFVPFRDATCRWLLPGSWIVFGLAIAATISSFFTSNAELDNQLKRAEDYLVNRVENARERVDRFDDWTRFLNGISGLLFVLGVGFTVAFISINLSEGSMARTNDLNKGAGIPRIPAAPQSDQTGNRGAVVPKIPTVPSSPKGSPSGANSGTQSNNSGQ